MARPSALALAALLATSLMAVAPKAQADRRAFGHVYEYQTMPEGGLDLEIWNTQARPRLAEDPASLEVKLETEYGITDHWDLALYQIFTQTAEDGSPMRYAATALETRYRFAERGELPVDVLGYFEALKTLSGSDLELEGKVILARDFGALTVAANLILELGLEAQTALIPGWALGLSYELSPALKLGAETFGALEISERGGTRKRVVQAWAGPAVSWSPSPKLWFAASAAFGLSQDSDDLVARLVIGISL